MEPNFSAGRTGPLCETAPKNALTGPETPQMVPKMPVQAAVPAPGQPAEAAAFAPSCARPVPGSDGPGPLPAPPAVPFTGADRLFAFVFAVVGLFYVSGIWLTARPHLGVCLFTAVFLAAVESYARASRLPATRAGWFWFSACGLCGLSFLWGSGAGPFAAAGADSFFAFKFLCLTGFAVYFVLVRMGALTCGETGSALPLDLWRGFVVIPFANYFAKLRCMAQALRRKPGRGRWAFFAGLLLAVPVVAVVLPQLLAADAAFARFFTGLSSAFSGLFAWQPGEWTFRIVFSLPVASYLFGLCSGAAGKRHTQWPTADRLAAWSVSARRLPVATLCTLLSVICALYALFIGVQTGVLFSAWRGVLPAGFTFAEYARQGFFELCRVAAVNLAVCCAGALTGTKAPAQSRPLRTFLALLCGLTLVLIASAGARMALYIAAYGFTPRRLLTSFFLAFLFFVFCLAILRLRRPFGVLRLAAGVFALCFMLLCLSGPESWMPAFNACMGFDPPLWG